MLKTTSFCNICGFIVTSLLNLVDVPPIQNKFFPTQQQAQNFTTADINFSWCKTCQHISVNKTQNAEFDASYNNDQSASEFAVAQFKSVVTDIKQQVPDHEACIVEIGCGRGEFLEMLRSSGYKNLQGYDPAAPAATDIISNKHWDGFTQEQGADLILTRHALETIADPNTFIGLMANSLKQDGYIYCEITNAPNLLKTANVFSLYSEYSNLFSALSLTKLYASNGLVVEKITNINNGEWLGVWGKKTTDFDDTYIINYFSSVHEKLLQLPKPVVFWGAAGRGENILAFLKLELTEIEFVVDINPKKHGLFIPPHGQKIISPEQLLEIKPKTIVIANKKYKNEIAKMTPVDCPIIAIDDL